MAKLNGDVRLTNFTMHGEENTAFDGTEDGTVTDDVAIQVTNKYKVG